MSVQRTRTSIDVSKLPTVAFGQRDPMWWGTLGFVVAEGMLLAVSVGSYFYVRQNFPAWPPQGTPPPGLLVPTANMLLLLASLAPARWMDRAAKRLDLQALRRALVVASIISLIILAVRAFEFGALNTRWDSNAYGSVIWVIIGFHSTLLVIDALETICLTVLAHRGPWEEKHFTDVSDGAFYWYYIVLVWLPLYALIFLGPRLL